MKKTAHIILGLSLVSCGLVVLLIIAFSFPFLSKPLTSEEIVQLAEKKTGQIEFPSRPEGEFVREKKVYTFSLMVPHIRNFPPRIEMEPEESTTQQSFERSANSDSEVAREYEKVVADLIKEREKSIEKAAQQIANDQSQVLYNRISQYLQMFVSIIGVLLGMMNLWLGFRKDNREQMQLSLMQPNSPPQLNSSLRQRRAKRRKNV